MSKKIQITAYDAAWPVIFEREAKKIKRAFGDNLVSIHHVGSTSVPGLAGKPKIDIMVEVQDLSFDHQRLIDLNYSYDGGFNIPMRKVYGMNSNEINVNLHIYEENDSEVELQLLFRDYLRSHPKDRDKYAHLKYELVQDETAHQKNGSVYNGYTLRKADFIQSILKKAGFSRTRFVFCTYDKEWEAARSFRNRYFFDPHHLDDPYTWTFKHENHKHFVLYKGTDIVGYAHVQLWPLKRAALRMIAIDEERQKQGFGSQLLQTLEKWLKSEGVLSVHTEASPAALSFYKNRGYSEMPFDDPDGTEGDSRDTPLGKSFLA